MEVSGSDGKKVIWVVVDDHVLDERNNHDEIGLWGLILIVFDKDNEEFVREGLIEYPCLLM